MQQARQRLDMRLSQGSVSQLQTFDGSVFQEPIDRMQTTDNVVNHVQKDLADTRETIAGVAQSKIE